MSEGYCRMALWVHGPEESLKNSFKGLVRNGGSICLALCKGEMGLPSNSKTESDGAL